jgi:hypothetical protein
MLAPISIHLPLLNACTEVGSEAHGFPFLCAKQKSIYVAACAGAAKAMDPKVAIPAAAHAAMILCFMTISHCSLWTRLLPLD